MNRDIEIKRWNTPLSGCSELYFVELTHGADLCLTVEDEDGNRFEVVIADFGPYRVLDEQYLVRYWDAKDKSIGWTFNVIHSEWSNVPTELLEVYLPDYKHYAVATLDYCLEVLVRNAPIIRRLTK